MRIETLSERIANAENKIVKKQRTILLHYQKTVSQIVGTYIVLKGFQCRTLTCRNAALACVKKWVKLKKMPLKELSPELFEAVSELYPAEPNENARKTEKELLEGKTDFSE